MEHLSNIKMIFVDLDGTLVQGVNIITPRTIRVFERIREMGIIPVIATGRPLYETDFACQAIGANGYLITMNGLEIYENYRMGKLLYEAYMPEDTAEYIMDFLFKENVFFQTYAGGRSHCQKDKMCLIGDSGIEREYLDYFVNMTKWVENLWPYLKENSLRINKFFVCIADRGKRERVRKELEGISGIRTLSSGENYVEVVPEGTDKRRAVKRVKDAEGLTNEQVMVIGDSENDLGMFDEACTCVAMGNACPQLKAKANYIAPANDEEGVACILERLLLTEKDLHQQLQG